MFERVLSSCSQDNTRVAHSPRCAVCTSKAHLKGIAHFEINFWYVLVYFKGIQDVGVFVSTVVSIFIFLGQTVLVCQSYNGGLWSPPHRACTEKSKLNMI